MLLEDDICNAGFQLIKELLQLATKWSLLCSMPSTTKQVVAVYSFVTRTAVPCKLNNKHTRARWFNYWKTYDWLCVAMKGSNRYTDPLNLSWIAIWIINQCSGLLDVCLNTKTSKVCWCPTCAWKWLCLLWWSWSCSLDQEVKKASAEHLVIAKRLDFFFYNGESNPKAWISKGMLFFLLVGVCREGHFAGYDACLVSCHYDHNDKQCARWCDVVCSRIRLSYGWSHRSESFVISAAAVEHFTPIHVTHDSGSFSTRSISHLHENSIKYSSY